MKKIICLLLILAMLSFPAGAADEFTGTAVWQDPGNVVVMWENEGGYECNILRSSRPNGKYISIGSTSGSSFRDDSVEYPNTYYYKIEMYRASLRQPDYSLSFEAVIAPEQVAAVSVIMYHNFVTLEDIRAGIDFDEYSIDPSAFEADLIWLKENGYVTVTSADLLQYLRGEKSLPEKAVIISIDDGSWGVYNHAWPLLKKYNMKADFNVIGANIDATWESLYQGNTRAGEPAPYCTWEELIEMSESGEINLCSHTYGMHVYNREKRIGMSMMEGESPEDFAAAVKKDYELMVSCIGGWTGISPETVAYPYSKRSAEGDDLILDNTGYRLLMAGQGARGTAGNYFVKGCDFSQQLKLMSRPCRMDGTPISVYLENIRSDDAGNGVNLEPNYFAAENVDQIAEDHKLFDDVAGTSWYAGSVYYAYLNKLMNGVSHTEFAPNAKVSRAMAATLLNRLAGSPAPSSEENFTDAKGSEWWVDYGVWANEHGVFSTFEDGSFRPNSTVSRELLAQAMFNCGGYMGLDMAKRADLDIFTDEQSISEQHRIAVSWAVANGIFHGYEDGSFRPGGSVTRAEMATILRNILSSTKG